jgi:hypothetical protein
MVAVICHPNSPYKGQTVRDMARTKGMSFDRRKHTVSLGPQARLILIEDRRSWNIVAVVEVAQAEPISGPITTLSLIPYNIKIHHMYNCQFIVFMLCHLNYGHAKIPRLLYA